MNSIFEAYRPRSIEFCDLISIDGWKVKVYTITNRPQFESSHILEKSKENLSIWLDQIDGTSLPTYKQAFLIVHEAREGVWILLNWWTGGEMVETKVFFSSFEAPNVITDSPYSPNTMICVWELEVFAHERASWIEHILSKSSNPDYSAYTSDTLNKAV